MIVEEFINLQNLIKDHPKLSLRTPDAEGRVFPNTFSPIITAQQSKKIILPMRYRLRPNGSTEEIPSKFNVFNARLDSLLTKKTWKPLIGKHHGLVTLEKFYEWVPDHSTGKTKLISFTPIDGDHYFSPCIYDYWKNQDGTIAFYSFAIITTDPTPQILEMGHDRSPIFLDNTKIESWLNCNNTFDALQTLKKNDQLVFETLFE